VGRRWWLVAGLCGGAHDACRLAAHPVVTPVFFNAGVEVAVVRSISNSNRRDKASIKMVQVGDFVVSVNGSSAAVGSPRVYVRR